jgi:serine phosphatase RsbU (regulator of sigma subunit)
VFAGGVLAPLWLRNRATAVLLATRDPAGSLDSFARDVAPHFELASGYTDVIDRARRRRRTSAAAEVQQDLLAPRITPIAGGEIAGTLLPAYDVGGDWFDHAENPEGAWLTVADAMGKGARATAVSALALAALRGARRAGDSLEECCQAVHATVGELGVSEPTFLTAVISTWHAASRTLAWVCCGHPPPLLVTAGGSSEELTSPVALPLGLPDASPRSFERGERHLYSGDRVIIYSDGITERRTATARFGIDGLLAVVRSAEDTSPVATAAAIESAVLGASDERMSDDATQLILRVA